MKIVAWMLGFSLACSFFGCTVTTGQQSCGLTEWALVVFLRRPSASTYIVSRDVMEPAEIRFCRMRILYIKICWMRICWCMIKVQPNTLVYIKFFLVNYYFLSFTLQQISMKDYDIVKLAHTFYFNNQWQTVSRQQLIFLKFKTKVESESDRKRVCKSDGFGFVKKWRNLLDSKSDSKFVTSLIVSMSG